jgi:hypothetical protein
MVMTADRGADLAETTKFSSLDWFYLIYFR